MKTYDAMRAARTMDEPTTVRFVFVMLAGRIGHEERAWPSISTLCADTGLGDTAVRMALKRLVAAGYLSVIHRRGSSSLWTIEPRHVATDTASSGDTKRVTWRQKARHQTTVEDDKKMTEDTNPNGNGTAQWHENGDGTVSRPQPTTHNGGKP